MRKEDLISLRTVQKKDLELLLRWENDPEYMTSAEPHRNYSKTILERYIERAADDLFGLGSSGTSSKKPIRNAPLGTSICTIWTPLICVQPSAF